MATDIHAGHSSSSSGTLSGVRCLRPPLQGKPPPPPPEKRCIWTASFLEAAQGWKLIRPTDNFEIEMSSRGSLVELVNAVLHHGFQRDDDEVQEADEPCAELQLNAPPNWAVHFGGSSYQYQGWCPPGKERIFELFSELVDPNTGNNVSVSDLVWNKLKVGLHGNVESEAGCFEFRLQTVKAVKKSDPPLLFTLDAVEPSFSGRLEQDFLSVPDARFKAEYGLRRKLDEYYQGKNAWRPCRGSLTEYEPCQPERPPLTLKERELLGLLFVGAGFDKFQKAWLSILRYGIFHHRHGEVKKHWNEMQANYYDNLLEGINQKYRTKKAMIIASKYLALELFEACKEAGVPDRQEKPTKRRRFEY